MRFVLRVIADAIGFAALIGAAFLLIAIIDSNLNGV